MRGRIDVWKTAGYAALLGALVVAMVEVGLACAATEVMKKSVVEYGLYGISASLPAVTLSEKLKLFFSSGRTRKIKSRIRREKEYSELEFGEFLLIDERPSISYFTGVLPGLLLSSLVVAFLIFSDMNIFNMSILIVSFIFIEISYLLSKKAVNMNFYMRKVWSIWALFFALWWGMAMIYVLKFYVEQTYHIQLWEKMLGIPPLSTILFAFILFLFSSIFWRADSYLSRNRGPFSALSIVFMAAGIAAIFPPLWTVFSTSSIYLLGYAFIITHLFFTGLLFIFAVYRGGMRFMFTSRRIILSKNFIISDLKEYPYDRILSIDVSQGFLGKHFDFGDLKFTLKRERTKEKLIIHGIKNPMLVRNTVIAIASKEKDVLDWYGNKAWTSGIDSAEYHVPGAERTYPIKTY